MYRMLFLIVSLSCAQITSLANEGTRTDVKPTKAQEREAILEAIVAETQIRVNVGTSTPSDLTAAKLELLHMRLQHASTSGQRIAIQRQIVKEVQESLKAIEEYSNSGVADRLTVLKAKERWLLEEENLERLEASK